jgi:hypothetical protein
MRVVYAFRPITKSLFNVTEVVRADGTAPATRDEYGAAALIWLRGYTHRR